MILAVYVLIALVGAAVGSFLNVCIFRLPQERSIITPSSACLKCGHPIRFYDNIPIISFLWLRGRCRDCGQKISPQYIAVELLTMIIAVMLFWKFGFSLKFLFSFIFTSALIVITFIDLDHQIIPDVITLPGIPVSFLIATLVMGVPMKESLLGIVAGGGFLWAVAFVYELITKREGIGGGDIKFLAMLGAFLGWKSLLFIVFFSSLLGSMVGLFLMATRKAGWKYAVPYGPFLALASLAFIFVGERWLNLIVVWY